MTSKLIAQSKRHILDALADGQWQPIEKLQRYIPDHLANAQFEGTQ